MFKIKLLKKASYIVFALFCLTTFWYPFHNLKASNIKTVVITFNTTPTSATASKSSLKYNKDFAFSYSFDDGLSAGYDPAFKYMNGGYSDYMGQYFGGLYFTDGTGNNVPFRGGYAFYSRNSSYSDLHVSTPSYVKWTQLQESIDNAWDIFNHGYTSSTVPVNDPGKLYYSGDPGGHAVGPLDYSYELSQLNVDVSSHLNLKNNSGVVTTPFNVSQIILPNGDKNYVQPGFDLGFNAEYAQDNTYTFDGSTTVAPEFTNASNAISSNRHVMPRWFDNEYRYLSTGEYPGGLYNHVDQLASMSTGSNKYWAQEFTHQITTSTYSPDWNGGMTWNSWKSLMDHVENTYGRFGNDKAWVAGAEEVYDYMMVKQNTVITENLVGNQLTVSLDVTNVPASLRNYALSLLVNSDATISSIDYGTDFTSHTDNKTTGLINIDWGVNSYSKNDITRVESLVSAAEVSKRKSDIDVARGYSNLLQTSAAKTSFTSRLNAIVVPLRTWYVNVKGISTLVNCNDSNGATNTKTYSPSVYNWNLFTMGNSSAISCGDLLNLKDSDSQISSLSLSNTAPFKSGGLNGYTSGNNTGLYPDTVINENVQIYSSTTTPAKFKIYGLESMKTYNIKLFGSTSAVGATGNSAITLYTIGGQTKELIVKTNLTNTVEFLDVLPVSGEIEVTVAPKVAAWGYGFLNAFEIKENLLAAPSSLSYNSPNIYTKNNTITPLSPTVTGQGITYSISPSLPSGLSFNTSTGVISGTPTEIISSSNHTVTALNTGGSVNFGINISVNDVAPSSLSYNTPNLYTRGTIITPLSPTVTGQGITYSISPSLPAGLSLDEITGIISGTPTSINSLSTYTVTAQNTGGIITFGIEITVSDISIITPQALPLPGLYNSPQSVSISSTGSDYIKYATDAIPATCSLGTLYSGPINISSSQTIYARACNSVGNSSTSSFEYIIDTVSPEIPISSFTSGSYNTALSVSLSSIDSNYIKYSNASMPATCSLGTLYSGPVPVSSSSTLYVRACDDAGNSSTVSFAYVIDMVPPETPLSSVTPGIYNSVQSASLSSIGSDYIRYGLASMPATCSLGTLYSGSISISSSSTLYVRACDTAGNSTTSSFIYTIDTTEPLTPIASPLSGTFNSNQSISISASGSDSIRYDTSSMPADCSAGSLYSGPINISSSQTIYVRSCDVANNSSTSSFVYVIDTVSPSTPVSSVLPGIYNSNQSISLSSEGSSYIKYGTSIMPNDCSLGLNYSGEILMSSPGGTVYVRACDDAGNSSTASFIYNIDTTPPEIPLSSLTPKTYYSSQSVVLSSVGSNYIRYAIDATPSSCSSGILYAGAIAVSDSQTIYVRACDDAGNSSIASFAYIISAGGSGEVITTTYMKYSTVSMPVDCLDGTLYTQALSFTPAQKIYIRVCNSLNDSSISTFEYITPGSIGNTSGGGSSSGYRPPVVVSPVVPIAIISPVINPVEIKTTSNVEIIKVTKDLKFGIKNNDVKILQLFLIKENEGPNSRKLSLNGATNYFGKLTKLALSEWQKANKVYPSAGYFGSISRAKIKLLNL